MSRAGLIAELILLFIALPLGFRYSSVRLPALPVLWVVVGYGFWQLMRDPHFDRARLWNAGQMSSRLGLILTIFIAAALVIWLAVRRFAPSIEFGFVRQHPALWALVMVAYPIVSVYPQGILYRAFSAAFSFLHIIFRNSLAIILTFLGGLLFAASYAETGSLAVSSFEHALYGCWLFTVGLGQYIYHGSVSTFGPSIRR
jgi:hypothetical protein